MFEVKNVSKQYGGEFALNSITMDIGKGMNFIIGASGSGKTTLLKILCGLEQDFDGDAVYCGKSIKALSLSTKSYFYNNVFGFVWQEFHLLEEATVLENILLPQYLKGKEDSKTIRKVLRELKIEDLHNQKVKDLSGGQKQRVAIARELIKNPKVILADEPTSALDKNTAKIIMDILRTLSKNRIVIVVTHDTSLITKNDRVYEFDKGELLPQGEKTPEKTLEKNLEKTHELTMQNKHGLSLFNALTIAKINMKNKRGRFGIAVLTLMLAGVLLLTTMSGAIHSGSQSEFDKLFDTYGETILDIGIVASFIDAAGTGGDEDTGPSGDVTQNTDGLYEKYLDDGRVAHIVSMQPFEDIQVLVDGESYSIEKSGNSPVLNRLIAGKMPSENGFEVVVPSNFIKKSGISEQDAIGKEIDFKASIYQWINDQPILKPVQIKAKIAGIADNTVHYDYNGQTLSFTVDDSFFFNKAAEDVIRKQAGIEKSSQNFTMRAKTPYDLILLKDELNQNGIVPLGRFELVEDMVRLNTQTTEQSGSASIIIGILGILMIAAIFMTTGIMRKREYAIFKVSGYHNKHLFLLSVSETILAGIFASFLMLIASPLINMGTKTMFGADILSTTKLIVGVFLIIGVSALSLGVTVLTYVKMNISSVLKVGDKA